MCDVFFASRLPEDADWLAWLLLADRLQMRRVVAQCVTPIVETLLTQDAAQAKSCMVALGAVSVRTMQLIAEVLFKAGRGCPTPMCQKLPQNPSTWSAPGDFICVAAPGAELDGFE